MVERKIFGLGCACQFCVVWDLSTVFRLPSHERARQDCERAVSNRRRYPSRQTNTVVLQLRRGWHPYRLPALALLGCIRDKLPLCSHVPRRGTSRATGRPRGQITCHRAVGRGISRATMYLIHQYQEFHLFTFIGLSSLL